MKKQYTEENLIYEGLTYEEAKKLMVDSKLIFAITRPNWLGYHFYDRKEDGGCGYVILTKDDELILDPKEIYDTDKNDWQVYLLTNWETLYLAQKILEAEVANA